jgi:hypothetical protein
MNEWTLMQWNPKLASELCVSKYGAMIECSALKADHLA